MFIELLQRRRSIRKYLARQVEEEKIDLLIEAALRSPSGRGIYPWEFIVVTDKLLLEKLSRAKMHGSAFLKGAPLAIVICADPDKQDVWIEDTSIAAITIHYAAASLGLGSCWSQIRKRNHSDLELAEPYVLKVLNLPEHLKVLAMVAIGYPDEQKTGHPKAKLRYEKVHQETYK